MRIIFFSFALLLMTVGFYSCSENTPSWAGRDESIPKPIYTIEVPPSHSFRMRSFSGVSKPADEVSLSFRVSGKLVSFPTKTGVHLKAGEVIGKLDSSDYELEVQRIQANVLQAKAQLQKAKSDYERTRLLYEASNVSRSVLDRDLSLYTSAKAQEKTAETALQISLKQVGYCTLTSPVEGDISSVLVTNFQSLQAGQVVAKIDTGKNLEVDIGVPELLISQIHIGDSATVVFDAFPDKQLSAIVTEVGVNVTTSFTYPVTLSITDHDERLRSSMPGEAVLRFNTMKQIISIPLLAIVGGADGKQFVWIYREATQDVVRRVVTVGELLSNEIEITSGLNPGEIIVAKGAHSLREGMKVKVLKE